jgi:predicted nucleic acid-binding protein
VSLFVLDNTITMAWCFTEEATALTEALLSRLASTADAAIVPALWLYEVVNVTELAVRRGRITAEKGAAFLESLADLPIEVESPTPARAFSSLMQVARGYQLTAYDASYLELAIRRQLPIATSDRALANAAHAANVMLVPL